MRRIGVFCTILEAWRNQTLRDPGPRDRNHQGGGGHKVVVCGGAHHVARRHQLRSFAAEAGEQGIGGGDEQICAEAAGDAGEGGGALVSTLQGQADAGVGLHVVLFAEPGLAARIDALQVLDVAVHDAPLPVFSVAEMHQLLRVRQGSSGPADSATRGGSPGG